MTVNTVLGPVPADELGVVAVHEALLSVLPGAEHAYDITLDRAEIFATLAAKLTAFRTAGGRTIVDSTGMFHGRDLPLYEALSRATGVHIVASTGLGPEEMLGGYFLTPQTNPPTPWPASKFADLFAREVTEGMVVPRVERRAAAGLVSTAATSTGMTATDESLLRGAARAALATGVPLSLRFGGDLDVVLDEKLPPDRVIVGDLDRRDAAPAVPPPTSTALAPTSTALAPTSTALAPTSTALAPAAVARRGAYVALDHVGLNDDDRYLTDRERANLVADLVRAGHGDRILLSANAIGVAKGHPAYDMPYDYVLSTFVPYLKTQGLGDDDVRRLIVDNPRDLLTQR
ncbi:hypothetical protein ACQPZX_28185 [Actinoplanes sp. CA-142083]|uniref:phosphotriesterase family protein n=1 Tax=Actinoplanes sp. CA-142083 TaxID=3239903 RepID=UPI003D8C406E